MKGLLCNCPRAMRSRDVEIPLGDESVAVETSRTDDCRLGLIAEDVA